MGATTMMVIIILTGMGLITTTIMMEVSTGGCGRRMFMYSGITATAGSIMLSASEDWAAAAPGVDFTAAAFTAAGDFMEAEAMAAAAATADDGRTTKML